MRVKHHNYLVSAFLVTAQMLRLAQLPSRGPAQQQPPPRRRPNRNQKRKLKADQEAFERVLRAKGLTLDDVSAAAASCPPPCVAGRMIVFWFANPNLPYTNHLSLMSNSTGPSGHVRGRPDPFVYCLLLLPRAVRPT